MQVWSITAFFLLLISCNCLAQTLSEESSDSSNYYDKLDISPTASRKTIAATVTFIRSVSTANNSFKKKTGSLMFTESEEKDMSETIEAGKTLLNNRKRQRYNQEHNLPEYKPSFRDHMGSANDNVIGPLSKILKNALKVVVGSYVLLNAHIGWFLTSKYMRENSFLPFDNSGETK